MPIYFDDSSEKRQKLARKRGVKPSLERSPIPTPKPYELLTKEEIWNGPSRSFVFDVESYTNYFVVGFKCLDTGKVIYFEDNSKMSLDREFLSFMLYRHLFIGFNSANYDLPIIAEALRGLNCFQLKAYSNYIIYDERPKYNLALANINHIDLIEPAPLTGSLKLYAARCHAERLQDLPYEHDRTLSEAEMATVRDYNLNDLDLTEILYKELKPFLDLRTRLSIEYNQELRSKSDSQIAEAILLTEIRKTGQRVGKSPWVSGDTFKYIVPSSLEFKSPQLKHVLEVIKEINFVIEPSGYVNTPEAVLKLRISFGNCIYQLGNGGLHSNEHNSTAYSNAEHEIIDRDVASYYPNLKIIQGLYPKHIGPIYLEVYKDKIVTRRLKAKAEKRIDEADGLKIVSTGSFGKNGSPYSPIYAPDVLLNITYSGQLFILMFIEILEMNNFSVLSANTDGVVTNVPVTRYDEFVQLCKLWEDRTGFITEETKYKSYHARDVNNYIAVKTDNKCKLKGVYSEVGSALNSVLSKNPETLIISDAIQAYVCHGTPIEQTIRNCTDIKRFVSVRNVRGGAEKEGYYLGRVVRWYYSNYTKGTINYVTSGNAVAKTEGGKPCMILPTLIPDDLNYDWYINKTVSNMYDLGIYKKPETGRLI